MYYKSIKPLFFLAAESLIFIAAHIVIFRINHNFHQSIFLTVLIYILYLRKIKSNIYNFIITLLVFSIFAVTIPAMNDRSGTVYLMKSIQKKESISKMDLENQMEVNYLNGSFTEKRLQEQLAVGNIVEEDGSIRLTKKGQIFTNVYNFFALCYRK